MIQYIPPVPGDSILDEECKLRN